MKRSIDRILTTHCGSLARPKDLLDIMKAKVNGEPYDETAYAQQLRTAVAEVVRKQNDCGIDIVTDGEQGKPGFFAYVRERLAGFEAKAPQRGAWKQWAAEVAAFPEYYEQYFSRRDGRKHRAAHSNGVHRAGQLSRAGGDPERY